MKLFVFLAGISVGWAADRLYNSYIAKKTHGDKGNETLKVKAEEKESSTEEKESSTEGKESLTEKKESLEEVHDDLTQLKGVGPKLAEAFDAIGIYNYEQLSKTTADILLERLQKTGGRFNKPAILVILERAKQAAEKR